MRIAVVLAVLVLLVAPAVAQFRPVPGFAVGFNPNVVVTTTTWNGQVALALVMSHATGGGGPRGYAFAQMFEPVAYGRGVILDLQFVGGIDSRPCAVGARLQVGHESSAPPVGIMPPSGLFLSTPLRSHSLHPAPLHSIHLPPEDLNYCGTLTCPPPSCEPQITALEVAVLVFTVRYS